MKHYQCSKTLSCHQEHWCAALPIKHVQYAAVQNVVLMSVHSRDQNIQATSLQLLNRLSDWLFVASRALQRAEGGSEVLWQKNINDTIDQ